MKDIFDFFEKPRPAVLQAFAQLQLYAQAAGLAITNDDGALAISISPPGPSFDWSYGEVESSQTYDAEGRTVPGGLRCQRIFGPIHDYECACGKYKRMKHRGTVCDECGVEVTRSLERRERLAHVTLPRPIVPKQLELPWHVVPILPPDLRPRGMDAAYAALFDGEELQAAVDAIARASVEQVAHVLRRPVRTDYSACAVTIVGARHRAPCELLRALTQPLLYNLCEVHGYTTTIKSSKRLLFEKQDIARSLLQTVLDERVFLVSGSRPELVATRFELSDEPVIELSRETAQRIGVRTGESASIYFPISESGQRAAKHLRADSTPVGDTPSWVSAVRHAPNPVGTLLAAAQAESVDPCETPFAAMFVGGYALPVV